MRALLALILMSASGCIGHTQVGLNEQAAQDVKPGFPEVPRPDPKVFSEANTAEMWTNPFLFVHPDGVELIAHDSNARSRHYSVPELERVLASLPVEAWPLGRAVAVQENGVGSGPEQGRTLKTLEAMLEANDIAINWWPTA